MCSTLLTSFPGNHYNDLPYVLGFYLFLPTPAMVLKKRGMLQNVALRAQADPARGFGPSAPVAQTAEPPQTPPGFDPWWATLSALPVPKVSGPGPSSSPPVFQTPVRADLGGQADLKDSSERIFWSKLSVFFWARNLQVGLAIPAFNGTWALGCPGVSGSCTPATWAGPHPTQPHPARALGWEEWASPSPQAASLGHRRLLESISSCRRATL